MFYHWFFWQYSSVNVAFQDYDYWMTYAAFVKRTLFNRP